MPSLKITYFPFAGRAEPSRVALYVGGIDFEDERIPFPEFGKMKQEGKLPFGSFPLLTIDGEVFAQSSAILRYCGKLANLYPTDPKKALLVDQIVDVLEDGLVALFSNSSEEARQKFEKELVPRYIGAADKIFAKHNGPFLLGDEMSIADIKLMAVISGLKKGGFDHVSPSCVDKYENVMKAVKATSENKKVVEWLAKTTK